MNKSELYAFVKSDSIKRLVKASDVKTQEDIKIFNDIGYCIGFTYDELQNVFPEIVAENLYFNNGLDKAFYYDKEKLILFPVALIGKQALKPLDELGEEIIKRSNEMEKAIENADFYPSLMVLNDKMRMEMLNLFIEKDKIKDGYTLFKNFYQTSDFGCSELTLDSIRKIRDMKTEEHQKETEMNLQEFPQKITVYRGEGDRSANWKNTVSWTTDINVANFFASRMVGRNAKIYIAEVDKKDIIDYFDYENECIILPDNIQIIDRIDIKGLDYIESVLPKVVSYYHDYRELITDYADFNTAHEHGKLHSARVLLLCFDTAIDAEKFCNTKSALFLIMPEEDNTKYFLVSLIVQQLYREMLAIADESKGKLKNRVMFYLDEIGTIPKIDSAEMMFSAGRSRRISIIAIIQSKAQLEKNYGKEGAEIIIDNCQLTVFGGFAPNSETAEMMSKNLGEQTIMSGSITQSKGDGSRSLQMVARPLMTVDELKTLPRFHFIITKTGCHPMRTKLDLFFNWGIELNTEYTVDKKEVKEVYYAGKDGLMEEIERREGRMPLRYSESASSKSSSGGTIMSAINKPTTNDDVEEGAYEVGAIRHKARPH